MFLSRASPARICRPLQVASVDYLVPIVGVTAGVVFLNESFNSNVIVAAVFIFISLLMNTKEEFSN